MVAEIVSTCFMLHRWYLTAKVAPFAFFSAKTTPGENTAMAKEMHASKQDQHFFQGSTFLN